PFRYSRLARRTEFHEDRPRRPRKVHGCRPRCLRGLKTTGDGGNSGKDRGWIESSSSGRGCVPGDRRRPPEVTIPGRRWCDFESPATVCAGKDVRSKLSQTVSFGRGGE